MSSYARTLYGLRTLRVHGMPQAALHLQLVFRSIALAKLLYAGALQMQGTGIVWKASSGELRKQATITMTRFLLWLPM